MYNGYTCTNLVLCMQLCSIFQYCKLTQCAHSQLKASCFAYATLCQLRPLEQSSVNMQRAVTVS